MKCVYRDESKQLRPWIYGGGLGGAQTLNNVVVNVNAADATAIETGICVTPSIKPYVIPNTGASLSSQALTLNYINPLKRCGYVVGVPTDADIRANVDTLTMQCNAGSIYVLSAVQAKSSSIVSIAAANLKASNITAQFLRALTAYNNTAVTINALDFHVSDSTVRILAITHTGPNYTGTILTPDINASFTNITLTREEHIDDFQCIGYNIASGNAEKFKSTLSVSNLRIDGYAIFNENIFDTATVVYRDNSSVVTNISNVDLECYAALATMVNGSATLRYGSNSIVSCNAKHLNLNQVNFDQSFIESFCVNLNANLYGSLATFNVNYSEIVDLNTVSAFLLYSSGVQEIGRLNYTVTDSKIDYIISVFQSTGTLTADAINVNYTGVECLAARGFEQLGGTSTINKVQLTIPTNSLSKITTVTPLDIRQDTQTTSATVNRVDATVSQGRHIYALGLVQGGSLTVTNGGGATIASNDNATVRFFNVSAGGSLTVSNRFACTLSTHSYNVTFGYISSASSVTTEQLDLFISDNATLNTFNFLSVDPGTSVNIRMLRLYLYDCTVNTNIYLSCTVSDAVEWTDEAGMDTIDYAKWTPESIEVADVTTTQRVGSAAVLMVHNVDTDFANHKIIGMYESNVIKRATVYFMVASSYIHNLAGIENMGIVVFSKNGPAIASGTFDMPISTKEFQHSSYKAVVVSNSTGTEQCQFQFNVNTELLDASDITLLTITNAVANTFSKQIRVILDNTVVTKPVNIKLLDVPKASINYVTSLRFLFKNVYYSYDAAAGAFVAADGWKLIPTEVNDRVILTLHKDL